MLKQVNDKHLICPDFGEVIHAFGPFNLYHVLKRMCSAVFIECKSESKGGRFGSGCCIAANRFIVLRF
jgi:hypothetical protein